MKWLSWDMYVGYIYPVAVIYKNVNGFTWRQTLCVP